MDCSASRSKFNAVAVGLLSLASWNQAAALSLVGAEVTGALLSPVGSTFNYFDPAAGFVPPGFGNSSSSVATVSDGVDEFGFLQGGGSVESPGIDSLVVDLQGDLLSIREIINPAWVSGLAGFEIRLTSPAFAGLSLSPLSDTFGNGGFASSLSGNTISLVVGPSCAVTTTCIWPEVQDAQFRLAGEPPSDVPEPGTLALLVSGLIALGASRRRRID